MSSNFLNHFPTIVLRLRCVRSRNKCPKLRQVLKKTSSLRAERSNPGPEIIRLPWIAPAPSVLRNDDEGLLRTRVNLFRDLKNASSVKEFELL